MLGLYIKFVSVVITLISVFFVVTLFLQFNHMKKKDHLKVHLYYRLQMISIFVVHVLAYIILMHYYDYSKEVLLLFVGEIGLLLLTNLIVDLLFPKSNLALWSIAQYLMVISFIIMARLDIGLGTKQFYLAALAYGITFLVSYIYTKVTFIQYLGIPAIVLAIYLLIMTNSTINGATNWLIIGNFSFQPSEVVKILYAIFIASSFVLFKKYKRYTILAVGVMTMSLVMIQVLQKDLGSALIYYVLFILMCYVFTTNRTYIIVGGFVTLFAGYMAYLRFSHVRVRIEAWLDPWADIDQKGYQIAQSLFAISNGGLTGSGLTLGLPNKIPVVTTDFIYSAIFEELGMVIGLIIIVCVVFFFLFGSQMIEKTRSDFDFLLGSALLIVLAFQSFLIIGGVTKAVPLTGVTLPFVSYGGSSLITTFLMLSLLQGIHMSQSKHKKKHKAQHNKLASNDEVEDPSVIRNKPLQRIKALFLMMFTALTIYIVYFVVIDSEQLKMNDYNPRLEEIETGVVRGDILDRNGEVLVFSEVTTDGQIRKYPYGNLFAHSIGFVGFGKTGLEAYGNLQLITAYDNIFEKWQSSFQQEVPKGGSMITSFDLALQQKAYDLLGDQKGAIIAMNPKTGEILAMVSKPDFDPSTISSNFNQLVSDKDSATLLNRATQGLYPPGSTYKTITAIAYLENFKESEFFNYCMGEDYFGQKVIHCYNNTAHGRLNLEEAFAHSCNTSFAKIGSEIDQVRLGEISEQFLFNQEIPFELEVKKSQFNLNAQSSGAEMTETVIGQGKTLITPLNNVLIASAIANDGVMMKPRLYLSMITEDGKVSKPSVAEELNTIMTTTMADKLESYMVSTSEYGTAHGIDTTTYEVASKTGSAENSTGPAHAWYIGYAPVSDPQIALVIVVENVGSSSVHAVPIADSLYQFYLK